MKLLTCAADDCVETFEFDPQNPLKEYHSLQCQRRMRVRRWRAKNRKGGGGDDGGGGPRKRQMTLFAKEGVSAKRIKRERPPETAPLFAMSPNGMHEKHVGPAEVSHAERCVLPVIGRDNPDAPISPSNDNLGGSDAVAA